MNEQKDQKIAAGFCRAMCLHDYVSRPPDLDYERAYRIQLACAELMEAQGQPVIGRKIGMTNRETLKNLDMPEPICAFVFSGHLLAQDEPVSVGARHIQAIEPELAFVLESDLNGPGVSPAAVLAATRGVMPAFELISSRYRDPAFIPPDCVADNAHCGGVILGDRLLPVDGLDLRATGLVLEKNGQLLTVSAGAAVYGHPAASVAWLANKANALGRPLKAGEIIMSGSFTAPLPVQPADVFKARFGGIGCVGAVFAE